LWHPSPPAAKTRWARGDNDEQAAPVAHRTDRRMGAGRAPGRVARAEGLRAHPPEHVLFGAPAGGRSQETGASSGRTLCGGKPPASRRRAWRASSVRRRPAAASFRPPYVPDITARSALDRVRRSLRSSGPLNEASILRLLPHVFRSGVAVSYRGTQNTKTAEGLQRSKIGQV
jgi:hypothetical protein